MINKSLQAASGTVKYVAAAFLSAILMLLGRDSPRRWRQLTIGEL
jgi:hypothetical protein